MSSLWHKHTLGLPTGADCEWYVIDVCVWLSYCWHDDGCRTRDKQWMKVQVSAGHVSQSESHSTTAQRWTWVVGGANLSALLFANINNNNNTNDNNNSNNSSVWAILFIPITSLKRTTTSIEPFPHTHLSFSLSVYVCVWHKLKLTHSQLAHCTDCNIKSEDMQWLAITVLSSMVHVTKLSLSRETLPLNSQQH